MMAASLRILKVERGGVGDGICLAIYYLDEVRDL